MNCPVLSFAIGLLLAPAGFGEEPLPHRQDRPPNPPRSPEEALRRMTVPEGFSVDLVASEPAIVNPVAMAFDDRGRIWITESLEYPRKDAGPGRDRVQVLEDTDLDGRADRFTVFADGLNIPTGIAVGYGGVWVLNAPDLLFMREKDGRAADREVVVTGFGRTDTHELPSSLTWGPDGWLYGLNGVFNQSRVVSAGREFRFTCALFRVHPRTREFQVVCEGTSNPCGLAWDAEGSAIVSACHWAKDHLFHFVETGSYQRQAGAYPPYVMKIGSITDHGHQKTAYCGLAWLDSPAYPEPYRGLFYLGNIHGGSINADRLSRDGSTYLARAEPDLLAANDAWFMPVSQKVGPDGCLYILDWYDRYHCYQDANRDPAGIDRLKGRLYRVRHQGSPRAGRFDLAAEDDRALVERLGSPNIFYRERAQRLLSERNAPAARALLRALVLDDAAPRKARLHALWALLGGGELEPDLHLRLLSHPDPAFRAWAARAAGNQGKVGAAVKEAVASLARDPSPDVLLQMAIAARKVEGLDPIPLLVEALARCGEDKLIPSIVWPNLHPLLKREGARFVRLAGEAELSRSPGLAGLLPRAVERFLGAAHPDIASVRPLLELLAARDPSRAAQALSAASHRIDELPATARAEMKQRLEPFLEEVLSRGSGGVLHPSALLLAARLGTKGAEAAPVRDRFLSPGAAPDSRLEALEALIAFQDPSLLPSIEAVIAAGPPDFAGRVLAALGKLDDPRLADRLIALFPHMDEALKPLALDLLLVREPWARRLLEAIREGKLPRGILHQNHLRKVLQSNDREAVWAVEREWGAVRAERNPEQEQVVAEMGEFLRRTPGDPLAGEGVFRKLCAQCHVIHGQGKGVGPDLTASGRASFEQLLTSVFDPSLVIGPGYQTTTVVTRDGRSLTGIVVEDGDQRIVLKVQGGEEVAVARSGIKDIVQGRLSLMPEGIEKTLERKEIADLFAFLSFDRHPRDPQASVIPGAPLAAPGKKPPASRESPARQGPGTKGEPRPDRPR